MGGDGGGGGAWWSEWPIGGALGCTMEVAGCVDGKGFASLVLKMDCSVPGVDGRYIGLLDVDEVFDDEGDSPSGSDESKVQTWSSQYYRGEPVVVVDDDKPLVFPVRSLKSRVSDSDAAETISESSEKGISRSRST
ncbi:hypothetical protein U1Q18_034598 [Sarracenia purpurea var. burkii]